MAQGPEGCFRKGQPFFHGLFAVWASQRVGHNGRMVHPQIRHCASPALVAGLLFSLCLSMGTAQAQDSRSVFRCPGPPVLYTDSLTPQEARDRGCRTIEGAPITIVQAPPKPKLTASGSAPSGAGARTSETRVDAASQRARDTDSRRILGDELSREEERLKAMQADYNNGEPERRGDERNYQRYTDRVAEMKVAILRKEADIAAIKREIAKLPQ